MILLCTRTFSYCEGSSTRYKTLVWWGQIALRSPRSKYLPRPRIARIGLLEGRNGENATFQKNHEKSPESSQASRELQKRQTEAHLDTLTPHRAALRVPAGGDQVGGLPPGCRSNVLLCLLPHAGRQRFCDFWVLQTRKLILL